MDTIGIANTPCTVVVLGLAARELLVAIAGNERQVAQASPDTTRTRQGRERHVDTKKLGQQGAALDQQIPQTTTTTTSYRCKNLCKLCLHLQIGQCHADEVYLHTQLLKHSSTQSCATMFQLQGEGASYQSRTKNIHWSWTC